MFSATEQMGREGALRSEAGQTEKDKALEMPLTRGVSNTNMKQSRLTDTENSPRLAEGSWEEPGDGGPEAQTYRVP